MRYVFFGTPRFAALILEDLIKFGLPPLAVIASPTRLAGRIQTPRPPATLVVAERNGIPVYQPERLTDSQELKEVAKIADLFLVAAYAKIIPPSILELPRLHTIGLHPSLLPLFRGPTPIQSTILAGATETGVTLYQMDALVDHGPILLEVKLPSYEPDSLNYAELEECLAHLGSQTFRKFIERPAAGRVQEESAATLTKKIKTEDAFVSERELRQALQGHPPESRQLVLRKILAFSTEPGAWTELSSELSLGKIKLPAGQRIKLLQAREEGGKLILTELQVAGRKKQQI